MLVSKSWCEETAKDIIWEFENLLCNNDVKINNMNPEENEFKRKSNRAVDRISRLCGRTNRRYCCLNGRRKK